MSYVALVVLQFSLSASRRRSRGRFKNGQNWKAFTLSPAALTKDGTFQLDVSIRCISGGLLLIVVMYLLVEAILIN